ncbi:L,D-transpeptidase [Microbacterium memoriense]|uniref:L,D-transpeptidase/peptidoglycan binding protein n=1 Tax=Microbacterium memoriense TaxID=2978350 RepID=A0ABT2PFT0_9MICO|nr:L,D-transpeptidase family protein [Microbacterium memoriense]MCT9002708.1 L,D-transpeptidase/peptidoglycan binding protein [Microbacterium memoriense]
MTDLATTNEADDTAPTVATDVASASATQDATPVEWAPAEPAAPKKRRLWLWIGVPALVVAGGAAAASLVLIAPGTSVAGVPVGFMTEGAATDAIQQRLAETTVTLGEGGPTVTGAELGASVDAAALAASTFADRPLWNVSQWFGDPVETDIVLEPAAAATVLRDALPAAYSDPTPAAVVFSDGQFTVTPAVDGTGIDVDAVSSALAAGFSTGALDSVVATEPASVAAAATTEAAQGVADNANALLATVGFYVGDERTVPVDAATAASWMTITSDETGVFSITADAAKIQPVVDTLPAAVNRDPINGTAIVNSDDTVLSTSVAGQDGRVLGDTSSVASDFAAQLAAGNGVYTLPVEVTAATTTTLARLLEVDVGEQRLYLKENGVVVDSWLISSGRVGADTEYGRYRIGWKTPVQTMRGTALDSGVVYEQPDVRWAMYFNGDQAFHGVYWHSSWGTRKSAGCVGMPNSRAEQIYAWAPQGTDVWIHD